MTIGIEPPRNPNGTEGVNSSIEYCVGITLHDLATPTERGGFSVCVSTVDGTATGNTIHLAAQNTTYFTVTVMLCMLDITAAGQDYHAVSNMYLGPFSNDDRRQCFTVNILNDTQSESSEYFMVSVQFCPGDKPERVDINPSSGNTTIIDDDGELLICKHTVHCE